MKLIYRLLPLLLSAMLIGCAQNPAHNNPAKPSGAFAPAGAGFTVNMPGTPQEKVSPKGTHIFISEVNGVGYLASYTDRKDMHLTPEQIDRTLDHVARAEGSAAARSGGKLLSIKRISVDGHNGRELRMVAKTGQSMRVRLTVVGPRLFQVGALTSMDHADAPETTGFLDSFHITMH